MRNLILLLMVLMLAALMQGCATSDDLKHIDDQLSEIRADVRTSKVSIENVNMSLDAQARKGGDMLTALEALKSGNAKLSADVKSVSEELAVIKRNQADLGSKMFTMSGGEMTSLSGRIEEIAHGAETTNAKLDALKAALMQQMSAIQGALGQAGGQTSQAAGGQTGGATDPSGAAGATGSEPSGQGTEVPVSKGDAGAASQPAGDPIQMYQTSYLDYTRGDYDVAIAGFREYLRSYPDTEYAGNAQYWIGESLYSLGRYQDALVEFDKVMKEYPDSQKMPGAMLKTGYCYEKLGDARAAKEAFEALAKKYPNSDAGKLAADKLKPSTRGKVRGR
ncbi:MAG: tol-pal system protein YbgF [Nitrospirae bacterium]|nr:tol-pal system protein YbgF [Nitrospirota bacterium]